MPDRPALPPAAGVVGRHRLIVFTRFPESGNAKTRLIPALGAEGAAQLQRRMTEHTLGRVASAGIAIEVRFAGGSEVGMRAWLGEGYRFREQGPGELGARLQRAVAEAFTEGVAAVTLIGTDCPELGREEIGTAFRMLATRDCVFGPAQDGGYYLVGVRRSAGRKAAAAIFAGIPWGGADVLAASLMAARRDGLTVGLLRMLADVDRPEDLAVWERSREGTPDVSVVIPTLNEAQRIGALVGALGLEQDIEVIVADGGSGDGTAEHAAAQGARVVTGARGRAAQMNAGAAAARGEILIFLHADTTPPPGFKGMVCGALADPGIAGGAFAFATDSPLRSLKIIARLANLRAAHGGIIFGDQAIFTRRSTFEAVGGYPRQPIMEDYALVRRLGRRGKVALLEAAAVSSARRWHERGPWRTSARNAFITGSYLLGVSPERLARWYR